MSKKSNRTYTVEFKQQAVVLSDRVGIAKAGEQLGINPVNIKRWKAAGSVHPSPSKMERILLEEENRRLLKENRELKDVNHILKRAAAFFSQDHLK
jgi:transposase-like protein